MEHTKHSVLLDKCFSKPPKSWEAFAAWLKILSIKVWSSLPLCSFWKTYSSCYYSTLGALGCLLQSLLFFLEERTITVFFFLFAKIFLHTLMLKLKNVISGLMSVYYMKATILKYQCPVEEEAGWSDTITIFIQWTCI